MRRRVIFYLEDEYLASIKIIAKGMPISTYVRDLVVQRLSNVLIVPKQEVHVEVLPSSERTDKEVMRQRILKQSARDTFEDERMRTLGAQLSLKDD